MEVIREWRNLDILMISQSHQFAVAIENKVDSGEHSEQLKRYRALVEQFYSGWRTLYFFLTPDGEQPSDEHYLPISYEQVGDIIERFVKARASTIGADVRVLLQHYVQMLRRHIVSDSEISRLCREIYRKHKSALDLIYLNIPDLQAAIKEEIDKLIASTPGILPDSSTKSEIGFIPEEWDAPFLRQGSGWKESKRILLLLFTNRPKSLRLNVYIGPGPENIRQQLFDIAIKHHPPFHSAYRNLNPKWNNIYVLPIFNQRDIEEMEFDALIEKLKSEWEKFLQGDLKAMSQVLKQYSWIWEEGNP